MLQEPFSTRDERSPHMKHFRLFLLVPFLLLAFSACRQAPPPPDPSLTAAGMRGGAGGAGGGDFVSGRDVAGAGLDSSLGLENRSSGFGADGIREEGILPSVYFDFDSSFVRPSDRPRLQEAADFLATNASARLLIEGHCDWRGTTEYNLTLGERRANSVKDFLAALGVSSDRIETVSFGDRMASTEANEAQMQDDRRADLVVIR